MANTLSSLDTLVDEVRRVREEQLRHFESLDTKGGVILGFAGALVAFANQLGKTERFAGSALALAAAISALSAFVDRDFPQIQAGAFRDRYLSSEAAFTKLHILDTMVAMSTEAGRLLRRKALRIRFAAFALGSAVTLIFSGSILVKLIG